MSDSSVFYELTKTISESERVELLSKIKKSIQFDEEEHEQGYHKELEKSERERLIDLDIKQSNIIKRFILWIKTKISSKNRRDVFVQLKIKELKKRINRKCGGLTGFETRDLTPKMAEMVWDIYLAILPLRDLFKNFWMKQKELETAYSALIEVNLDSVITDITDLASDDFLLNIYNTSYKKDSLKSEIIQAIDKYIDTIDDDYFESIADSLLPFYYLKEIILFPYASFFNLFQFTPVGSGRIQSPSFRKASAMLSLDYLEKLYYALYSLGKIPMPLSIDHNFLSFISQPKEPDEDAVQEPLTLGDIGKSEQEEERDETEEFFADVDTDEIVKNILEIIDKGKHFEKAVPLPELIKYFMKDPYFKIMFYVPRLDLKSFYITILKVRLLDQLDEKFDDIRRLYIDKEIERIFQGVKITNFLNYREYATLDHKKMGLPFFSHIKSLHLLYNFIKSIYPVRIQEVIQIISRSILSQNRLTRDRLMSYTLQIEDLEEKIRQFDFSMSTDSDDGKLFQKLRFSLGDSSHQKMYRSLITQKDREVKEIIDKGLESLFGLQKVFEEVLSLNNQNVRVQLKTHYFVQGKSSRLQDILESRIDTLKDFSKLLSQIVKLERY